MLVVCRAGVSRLVRTRRLLALRLRPDTHRLPASAPPDRTDSTQFTQDQQPVQQAWRDLFASAVALHSGPLSRSLSFV